jgi:hypothetical protein
MYTSDQHKYCWGLVRASEQPYLTVGCWESNGQQTFCSHENEHKFVFIVSQKYIYKFIYKTTTNNLFFKMFDLFIVIKNKKNYIYKFAIV